MSEHNTLVPDPVCAWPNCGHPLSWRNGVHPKCVCTHYCYIVATKTKEELDADKKSAAKRRQKRKENREDRKKKKKKDEDENSEEENDN